MASEDRPNSPRVALASPMPAAAPAGDWNSAWFQPIDNLVKSITGSPPPQTPQSGRRRDGDGSDVLTPKIQSLEKRLSIVEEVAKRAESGESNGKAGNGLSSRALKSEDQIEMDMLFSEEMLEAAPQRAASEGAEKPGAANRVSEVCGPVWGGPVAPYEDDTILSWMSNFFGGVTTAHGINRVFDDNNGLVRRIFWFFAFLLSLVVLVFQLESSISDFFGAATTTNIKSAEGTNVMPMMTMCNMSPIRCGCEGFYDPEIRDNDEYLQRVLPFLCGTVLGYNEAFTGDVDAEGRRINIQILETARSRVDLEKTRNKMRTFTGQLTCDNGPFTAAWFVEKVKAGEITTFDLMSYAGYHDRGRLVRFCQTKDDVTGEKVSCMDDRYWSPPTFDDQFGACHTLNPCREFPVGQECEADEDCLSALGERVAGGRCGAGGKCECTLCKAGADCKVVSQLKTGRGEGVRVVLNVAVDQDAEITAAEKARWSPGALVHLHGYANDKSLGEAVTAAPGRVTELIIEQQVFDKVQQGASGFPWTECYDKSITADKQCETSCLKRAQAQECCGASVPQLQDGRFVPVTEVDPSGVEVAFDNPVLLCNIFDPALETCKNRQTQKLSEGTICLHGAATFQSSAYLGFLERTGWYNPKDGDGDGIPDQEVEGWEIEFHCVWPEAERVRSSGEEESRHGLPCEGEGDDEACKSDSGDPERKGRCRKAYRAYCPGQCQTPSFEILAQSSSLLSETAAQIMANDELAWVSYQAAVDPNRQRRWQPRCGRDANGTYMDTATCFTTAEAIELVRRNYAMITVDYDNFDKQLISIEQKIKIDALLGTIGGNLGMWVGMSVMTIFEWFELGLYALLCMPFFYFGTKLPWLRKKEEDSADGDPDVQRVLNNIKAIAVRRRDNQPMAKSAELVPGPPPPIKPHDA